MLTSENIQVVKDQVAAAKTILVIFPERARIDTLASAASLFLGLQQLGKEVTLMTPVKVPLEQNAIQNSLSGLQNVAYQLGNKNLQISFNYQEDMVDKVSYNIDEGARKFHLIIQPKKDAKPLDSSTVEFSYTGAGADLIFLIGVSSLASLQQLYDGYEDFYVNTTTVSFNSFDTDFGSIKLNAGGSASLSEGMAFLLQEMGVGITWDIGTNLLAGIEDATDGLRSLAATADTFEIVSKLLRAGARRVPRPRVGVAGVGGMGNAAATNGFAAALNTATVQASAQPVTQTLAPVSAEDDDDGDEEPLDDGEPDEDGDDSAELASAPTPVQARLAKKKADKSTSKQPSISQLQRMEGGALR